MKKSSIESEVSIYLQKTIALLDKEPAKSPSKLLKSKTLKSFYDLPIHEIETEMQKEKLSILLENNTGDTNHYNFPSTGYFMLTNDGIICGCNITGSKLVGIEKQILLNNNLEYAIAFDMRPIFNEFLHKMVETNVKQSCEVNLNNNSNSNVLLEGILSADEQKCLVTMTDITERKRTYEALRQSEEKYKRFFEDDLSADFAMDGDGVLTDCNSSFVKMYGYSHKEELVGKNITILYRDPSEFETIKNLLKEDKRLTNFETIRKCKNGNLIDIIENKVATFNNAGEIIEIRGYMNDITERKRSEENMKLFNLQLKELNANKDKLFSIIAHDLKSPFSSILGVSELIYENLRQYDIEKTEKLIQYISLSSKETLVLLENLLSWAKTQTGKIDYHPQKLNFKPFILQIVELLKLPALSKNITMNVLPLDNVMVYADEAMLKIILNNLLTNAIKFTRKGGTISVNALAGPNQVEISVSDNGLGISDEIRDTLFSENSFLTTYGTANEKGTGLGLHICKEFVDKHHGKIWVESEPDKGSTFRFTMPC